MLQLKPLKPYVAQHIARLCDGLKSSVFKHFAIALLFSVLLHGLLVHQVLLAAFKQAAENATLVNNKDSLLLRAALVNLNPKTNLASITPSSPPPQSPSVVKPEVNALPEVTESAATEVRTENTSDAIYTDDALEPDLIIQEGLAIQAVQTEYQSATGLPLLPDNQQRLMAEPNDSQPYRSIETLFDVHTNVNARATQPSVGRASIVFKLDDDGIHYQIDSLIEPKGFAALFISNLTQTSRGLVSTQGLQPQQYDYQFGNKADKTYRAAFDWENRQLTLQTSKGVKQVPLKIGAQDLLSFMYQFMYVTPVGDLQVTMTNGKQLTAYEYRFAGQEVVQTKMGDLNTVHLARVKASQADKSDEKTEVWLALDYQYTPVKIRKIEKSGKMYELLATRIKTEAAN